MTNSPVDPLPGDPNPRQPQMPVGPPGPDYAATRRPPLRAWWLIGGGAVLVVIVVAVAVVVFTGGSSSAPSTETTVAPSDLDSLLLSATDANALMGVTDMTASPISRTMSTSTPTLTNPACLGVFWVAEAPVYRDSGYSGVRSQGFSDLDPTFTITHRVDQAAVSFPSAEKARVFLASAANTAKTCAGQSVVETSKQNPHPYRRAIGNPTISDTRVSQPVTPTDDPPCQHVVEAASNVVFDV
jgi:serine/threonine kinase PknH